jgi:hypothetical protein
MTPESVLNKIKLLTRLAESPNEHEAANAREMVDKLIAKYNIAPEELKAIADKRAAYGDDDLLFSSLSILNWKSDLASCLANEYYCKILQVVCQPAEGASFYNYHIYGDDADIDIIRRVFTILINKIDALIEVNCYGRGQIYIESYCEGMSEAIRYNIKFGDLDLPSPNREVTSSDKTLSNGEANLAPVKQDKEAPPPETVANGRTFIKNIAAYFKGQMDGKNISLQDLLDEANQKVVDQLATHLSED